MKPKVYLETTIISYLTGRMSRDRVTAVHQELTRDWFARVAPQFDCYVSDIVHDECMAGDSAAVARRKAVLDKLGRVLLADKATLRLARLLVEAGCMPQAAATDALHVAVAALHEMDYLLTWNCRHINRASLRSVIQSVCAVHGYRCPVICTPEELEQYNEDADH